jgi:DNA-binding beta-propeller fold protein YncE
VSETGKDGCARGRGLVGAFSLVISPDGRSLYVASENDVAEFVRHPETGTLTQLAGTDGCIAEFIGDGCGPGRALSDVASLAVSPDGHDVYVASAANQTVGFAKSAVVALSRDPSNGALSESPGLSGCTSGDGSEGCQEGKALQQAFSVVVAPNGRFVYVGSVVSSAVVSFARQSDGSLRQIPFPGECTSQGGREGCATGRGLRGVAGVAISPGGGYLYSGGSASSAVGSLFLTPTSGGLDQLKGPYGCTAENGFEGCATGHGLAGAGPLTVSPDGRSLYVAGVESLAAFGRELSNGRIDQLPGSYACFSEGASRDGCAAGRGLNGSPCIGCGVSSIAVSPDGRSVYAASVLPNQNGAVAVFASVPRPVKVRVRFSGVPHRCVSAPFRVSVLGSGTLPIRSLRLELDGRVVARSGQSPLTHLVDVRRLKRRSHTLTARAIDLGGATHRISARFRRC